MIKKRIWLIAVAALIVGALLTGATYALLMSSSHQLVNTFVSGDIELTLTESTGSEYVLVPGTTVYKDPEIRVKAGSEECWLFFKETSDSRFDALVTYSYADGWTALEGVDGVWWRHVDESYSDRVFDILKHDSIYISEDATEQELNSAGDILKLEFTAYAVQREGVPTPEMAWEIIKTEEGGV